MKEVNQRWGSDTARLSAVPPLLWSKIFHGLSPFLEFRVGSGGILVLRWSHRQLEEVASSCYLSSKERIFGILVDYFSGKLSEEIGSEQNTPHSSRGIYALIALGKQNWVSTDVQSDNTVILYDLYGT